MSVELTLAEAVAGAVHNNPSILARAQEPLAAAHDVRDALAVYEPSFSAQLNLRESKIPTGNALRGSAVLEEDERDADLALRKLLQTGAELTLESTHVRTFTNSQFQGLVPQYIPTLGLNFEQPLLRNFLGSVQDTAVSVARNDARSADADFEVELSEFVAEVTAAYWNATLAEADLEVRHRSLALARELARKAAAMVQVGSQAPIAAKEALAEASIREEEFLSAENALALAQRRLQFLVQPQSPSGRRTAVVVPIDKHVVQETRLDRRISLARALQNRAELRRARLDLESSLRQERNARNQKLPALDLVGSYTLLGLGGEAQPLGDPTDPDNPPTLSIFGGSYGDALDVMNSGDFYTYIIGLRLEVPFSNAAAEAKLGRREAERRRAIHQLQQAATSIALDVEEWVGNVESAFKRVAAAKLARELAETNLSEQRRRFELGAVTTTDVLDFQDRLTRAAAAEVRAVTDHAKALSQLLRAEGLLLTEYGIEPPAAQATGPGPWWSRF